MSQKKKQQTTRGKSQKKEVPLTNDPWISMRTALTIMGIVSAGLAVFVAWSTIPTEGVLMAIVWGLLFGAANWVVFFVAFLFFRWTRKGRDT